MKLLPTGICGFAGSTLAESLLESIDGVAIAGLDNLMRPGSETNRARLRQLGIKALHGDIRVASDFESLPAVDYVIDAAANPSVLAGLQQNSTSRQLFEHNLGSMVNVLEYCKKHKAGLVFLSSSRVYSIAALNSLPLRTSSSRFELDHSRPLPCGVSERGITSEFATTPPISLYGSMKLAAECIIAEYGEVFGFPIWINRCGVLAGAGQFGTPDQGIFSYWLNAHLRKRPLRYIGFDGSGKQVRDAFHPRDLGQLLLTQMRSTRAGGQRIYNVGGGPKNSISLAALNAWCDARFGRHQPESDPRPRPFDVPWLVMNSADAERDFQWSPRLGIEDILEEIAIHAEHHPDWLENSGV